MPLPKPKQNESEDVFVSRCMSDPTMRREFDDREQRAAACYSAWRDRGKTVNDRLLEAVRARDGKQTEFGHGIQTADRFVKHVEHLIGNPACYRWMCDTKTGISFNDVLEKAARTLVYSNPDMVVEEKLTDSYNRLPSGIKLPKNTLMVFKHTLTSSREDRDEDILESSGLEPDPKMLLLWQHAHTMPIGKMLSVVEPRSRDRLKLYSAIVDVNQLCHDCAVMVDNDMGRFSHGFKATQFEKRKAKGEEIGGFHILKGEIMEESMVTVPANIDAEVEEVIVGLVEGGKVTSPIMKDIGRSIREKMRVSVPVGIDLKLTVNGKEYGNEDKSGSGEGTTDGRREKDTASASEETDEHQGGGKGTKETSDSQGVKAVLDDDESGGKEANPPKAEGDQEKKKKCPECGSTDIENGVCQDCGYEMGGGKEKEEENEEEENEEEEKPKPKPPKKSFDGEKRGRVLSSANERRLRDVLDDLEEFGKIEGIPRTGSALIHRVRNTVDSVLSTLGGEAIIETSSGKQTTPSFKQASIAILTKATRAERLLLMDHLELIELREQTDRQTRECAKLFLASSR